MNFRPSGAFNWMLVMAAVIILMLFEAQSFPTNVKVTPLILGGATLVLFALLMAGEFYPPIIKWMEPAIEDLLKGENPQNKAIEENSSEEIPWPPVLRIMFYISGFWILVVLFGLIIIPPVFIIYFLAVEARVRLRNAIISSSIACTIFITGLSLLRVEMWLGTIPEIIPGILGGSILPDF